MYIGRFIYLIFPTVALLSFVLGVYEIFIGSISLSIRKYSLRHRLLSRRKEFKKDIFNLHLQNIIRATTKNRLTVNKFKAISASVFFIVFSVGSLNFNIFRALIFALMIGIIPYLMLRIKLENNRRKSSHEGETLIINLLTKYRIHKFNIYEAMEAVINDSIDIKVSKKILFNLLLAIRNTGSDAVIIAATKDFAFSIDTNWSRMLANNIQIAATKGVNVSNAIEDILIQLRSAKSQAEERKRLNSEAVRMAIFLVPLMYLATVFMSIKYLDMPVSDFLKNQFNTSQGFMLFIICIFLFLINLMLIEIVNNKSFDY